MEVAMTTNFKFIDNKKIDALIISVCKRSHTVQNDIHKVLCSSLNAWITDGNVAVFTKRINTLIDGLGGGMRTNAIKAWTENFCGLVWNQEESKFVYVKGKTTIDLKTLQTAKAEPFWKFKPESPYKPVDLPESILALINKADKAIDNKNDLDNIPLELLSQLKALI